jgi:hypothetical protein
LAQPGCKIAIDLDRPHVARALDQRARKRCLTGPDFDDGLSGPRIDRIDDSCHDAPVMQEILAEALTCSMRLGRQNGIAPGRYAPATPGGTR